MSSRGEAEFSEKTKRTLADRAGYRCSVPNCGRLTIGPGQGPDETASIGVAAHIYSAAPKGPRGRGGKSDAELAGIENGFWSCAIHGREIDTNQGRAYSAEELFSWKRLREEQARNERSGLNISAPGWLDRITIPESPLFRPGSSLVLGKATALSGGSFGKTALLEWMAAATGSAIIERWRAYDPFESIRLDLMYHAPQSHRLEFQIGKHDTRYLLDNQAIYEPPHDLRMVHLKEEGRRAAHPWGEKIDDITALSRVLDIEPESLRRLVDDVNRNAFIGIGQLTFKTVTWDEYGVPDRTDSYNELRLVVEENGFAQSYRSLSGSESDRVHLEIAAARARQFAKSGAAILLYEIDGTSFDSTQFSGVTNALLKQPFQTLMVSNAQQPDRASWRLVEIRRAHPNDKASFFEVP